MQSVVLTFDDAYEDVYVSALPILEARGWGCTLFAVSGLCGSTNIWDRAKGWPERRLMSAQQLIDAKSKGCEIGGHTSNHVDLTRLTMSETVTEVVSCRECLSSILEEDIWSFAYPFGRVNMESRSVVEAAGFRAAVGVAHGFVTRQSDLLLLPRITIFEEHNTFRLLRVLLGYRSKALRVG